MKEQQKDGSIILLKEIYPSVNILEMNVIVVAKIQNQWRFLKMNKSAFEEIKDSIIDSIKFSKNLTDLKERIETILQEYDLEEENAD